MNQQELAAWENLQPGQWKERKESHANDAQRNLQDVTMSTENGPFDPNRPTELCFKVKLTAEEYEMYLRERFSRLQATGSLNNPSASKIR